MTKVFRATPGQPLQGQPQSIPMGLYAKQTADPKSCTAVIDWSDYGVTPAAFAPVKKTVVYPLGTSVWQVPLDYCSFGAVLHAIGAGSGGETPGSTNGGSGGGGGAYARLLAPALTPGQFIAVSVPTGSPDLSVAASAAWMNLTGALIAPTTLRDGALAAGGRAIVAGANGGLASASIGDLTYNGGNGGVFATGAAGGGGGGAAGPNGAGGSAGATINASAAGGTGGGGANGGGGSLASGVSAGTAGGTNRALQPGGAGGAAGIAGSDASNAGAGGGGGGGQTSNVGAGDGGNGGSGLVDPVWTDSASNAATGPAGGGGGGGHCQISVTVGKKGGDGGLGALNGVGAGGAGGGAFSGAGGVAGVSRPGLKGAVVLEYYSTTDSVTSMDVNVPITLVNGVNAGQLDRIAAVIIDNTECNAAMTLRFNDTQQSIVAPPGAIIYAPATTNLMQCTLYASGFSNFLRQPVTTVTFLNRYIAPQTDYLQQTVRPQYLGSVFPNSPVANQQKFRNLAVGDLMWSDMIEPDLTQTVGNLSTVFIPPIALTGFYVYITDLTIAVHNMSINPVESGLRIRFRDESGIVDYNIPFLTYPRQEYRFDVLSLKNSQLKLPATSRIIFDSEPLVTKSGAVLTYPLLFFATVVMNYSIVDERQSE